MFNQLPGPLSKGLVAYRLFSTIIISITAFFFMFGIPRLYADTCLNLRSNFGYGTTDRVVNGQVLQLQKYLRSTGYLSAIPNGHFGQATEMAVKMFQTINGIDSIGYVGPATRAALKAKTCVVQSVGTVTTTANNADMTSVVSKTNTTTQSLKNISITAPQLGDILAIGDDYQIRWTTKTDYPYDIVLEHKEGYGVGFIATSRYGGNQYLWHAGKVYSSAQSGNINVATGTYRIRIQSAIKDSSPSDPVSDYFTLTAPKIDLDSVYPTSLPNDAKTVGVMFGNGFDADSLFRIDGKYGRLVNVKYVSIDGRVVVFDIPNNINPGNHHLYAMNDYYQLSNPIVINVTQRAN